MKADFDIEGVFVALGRPRDVGSSGKIAQDFTLVVEKFWGDDRSRRTEDVIDVTTTSPAVQAKIASFKAGDYVEVRGRIAAQPYMGRDGSPRVFTRLEVYTAELLILQFWSPAKVGGEGRATTSRGKQVPYKAAPTANQSGAPAAASGQDDDLPF